MSKREERMAQEQANTYFEGGRARGMADTEIIRAVRRASKTCCQRDPRPSHIEHHKRTLEIMQEQAQVLHV